MGRRTRPIAAPARLLLALTVLCAGLGLGPPPAALAAEPLTVTVTVERVRALDCHDEIDTPFGEICPSAPDMYALIEIDGDGRTTGKIDNREDISPGWRHAVAVEPLRDTVPIRVEIWDDDGGLNPFSGDDDHVDVTPGGDRNLDLSVNLRSCAILGDQQGGCWRRIVSAGTDNDRAEVTVVVDVNLPRTTFWGYLYDGAPPARTAPVEAHRVQLVDQISGAVLASQLTRADGGFGFDLRPPAEAVVRLEIAACEGAIPCEHFAPDVAPIDLQPIQAEPRALIFQGCPPGELCRYAPVDFFLRRNLSAAPPLTLSAADPARPTPPLTLRGDPPKATSAEVNLSGAGMHSWMQPFLFPAGCADLASCERYPAPILGVSPAGDSVRVRVPEAIAELGLAAYSRAWFWGVRNSLAAGTPAEWQRLDDTHLNYPAVHGFSFENDPEPTSYAEFEAVYGDNATICIGAFGACIARVPDPLYVLFYHAAYKQIVNSIRGSCAGMAATAMRLARGDLAPQRFYESAYAANGIPGSSTNDALPPRPPRFGPTNIWGEIRAAHGVQTSAEFLQAAFDDMRGGGFSIRGNPVARLDEVRADPSGHVICMNPRPGTGHCVTPYAVEDQPDSSLSRIWIYENNTPGSAEAFIDIDRASNTYSYPSKEGYSGTGIYTFPASVWAGERSMPGLAELLEFAVIAVFGDADALYSAPGGSWGWRPDGSFVETLGSINPITPFNDADDTTRFVPIAVPAGSPAPAAAVNVRGPSYGLFGAHDGHIFQMQVRGATPGATDGFAAGDDRGHIAEFRYTPQHSGATIEPRMGLDLGERRRAVFGWAGLDVPAGGTVGFSGVREEYSVAYENATGAATRHFLVLENVDGAAEVAARRFFGPFSVPAGAIQRATIIDWPTGARLRIDLDLDGDGVADESTVARGIIPGERVAAGLEAIYTFDEGAGATVGDGAEAGGALDLAIADPGAVAWGEGVLRVLRPTTIASAGPAAALMDPIQRSGELTLEAWVRALPGTGAGLARVAGLSNGIESVNAALMMEREGDTAGDGYVGRLRTTANSEKGRSPDLKSLTGRPAGELVHVAYTRDALGVARLYLDGALVATRQVGGDLANWDPAARLLLANEAGGERPWLGEYDLVAFYSRALSVAEVRQNFAAGPAGEDLTPFSGTTLAYSFDEGQGERVHDRSSFVQALDLTLEPGATRWEAGGLSVIAPTSLQSALPVLKVADASAWSNELSVELWVAPAAGAASAATIVGGSGGPRNRAFELTQGPAGDGRVRFFAQVRSSATGRPGREPAQRSQPREAAGVLHLVYTRDALGVARLYVDGELQSRRGLPGELSVWDEQLRLLLSNDADGGQPWLGTYRGLAVLNRALSPAEVAARLEAGP